MYLRQSTASQEISLGQFLDSTDGNTEEGGLTIANTDIKIRKHGGTTLINKNSGGATVISNGVYQATLDATDTNTAGMLEIYVHVAGALAVKSVYTVLTATAFDALLTGTFNNLGGVAQTADNDTKLTTIDTVVDGIQTDLSNGTDGLGAIKTSVDAIPTTAMRGTDNANTVAPDNASITAILADTNELQGDWVNGGRLDLILDTVAADVVNIDGAAMRGTDGANTTTPLTFSQMWTTQLTESYASDGTAPTPAQALFITMQNLQSFSFAGTTQTVRRIDDSTTAATYTLDDATNPTAKNRAT